jgi:ABC-2 type transport system ATP-binding protein
LIVTPGLRIEDVTVERGSRVVLDRVSFGLERGKIACVIGANGAGKTSLLETVVGFLKPRTGAIRWESKALATLFDFAAVFSFMADDAELPSEVRTATLIEDAQASGGSDPRVVRDLHAALEIAPLLSARAGELSKGEKRRVALFCALAASRPVIVLDEPLGAFDPLQLCAVSGVLRRRREAGASLLLSVHQMSDAERIADRVLILDRGRVLAFGSLEELRARAEGPGATLEEVFTRLLEQERGGP